MKLGYIMSKGRGETDPRLASVARQLMQRGLRLCGTIQVNTERGAGRHCDMDLMFLPNGPALRISQDRGQWASGCRLDAGSLELAVAQVAGALDDGADLVVINKFGKHEAEGRGFRAVIAAALDRNVPVLVGLNPLNREAFDKFSGGLATELDTDLGAILKWNTRRKNFVRDNPSKTIGPLGQSGLARPSYLESARAKALTPIPSPAIGAPKW